MIVWPRWHITTLAAAAAGPAATEEPIVSTVGARTAAASTERRGNAAVSWSSLQVLKAPGERLRRQDRRPHLSSNQPLSHVDIVVGSPEVEIDGIAKDGTVTPITRGCTFMLDRRSGLRTVAMVGVMADREPPPAPRRRERREDLSKEDRP